MVTRQPIRVLETFGDEAKEVIVLVPQSKGHNVAGKNQNVRGRNQWIGSQVVPVLAELEVKVRAVLYRQLWRHLVWTACCFWFDEVQ